MSGNATHPIDPLSTTRHQAPVAARWIIGGIVMLLLSGAAYLIILRHEAILADLATMTAWCF